MARPKRTVTAKASPKVSAVTKKSTKPKTSVKKAAPKPKTPVKKTIKRPGKLNLLYTHNYFEFLAKAPAKNSRKVATPKTPDSPKTSAPAKSASPAKMLSSGVQKAEVVFSFDTTGSM
jgi:hypothetical protein